MSKLHQDLNKDNMAPPPINDRFPRIVIIILLAEFCERFSYSGMKAFLTLYLRSKLGYTDDGATETYHVFSTLVYVFPIIGGILADNYLGKFRTILYMMFVYAAGNILVAVTAIPQLALPSRLCTLLGLFMITVGTGGIKPCVTAFGGDQFILPQQEKHLSVYFSVLYFNLCIGSLIAKTVSPILRSEVHCFGEKDCYSLAFGAPGFVVLLSIVVFVSAKSRYILKKPEGNIVIDFVKCLSLGIKNAILKRGRNEKYTHWLDTTQPTFDRRFIKDIKKTLSILMIFSVLPVFWALLDQMGSRWTLQATKMDGRFGFLTVKPDQMQVLSPIFILILIPLFQKYIYPFFEKRNMLKNPLHRLTIGGILAGVAFIASATVEIYLKINDRFPRIVIIILLAEFCERFSYSGMKAFLTLYLRSKLGYTDDGATETYHVFSTLVYVFPIIGGILADNYLGKFRTILYMMFVYAAGNILVAVTAIPQLALPSRLCTLLGLFMITVGTGGIKPCVTAFGGDQFILPQQEKHLSVYFSVLYFTLCIGSLIAKTVSPILRSEVHCFGEKDCYSLAFGAPGFVVLLSIVYITHIAAYSFLLVVFVSAKSRYILKKPEGNIVIDFVKCLSLGIKNAILKRGRNEKYTHWLDTTQPTFDRRFIKDIKKTLSILMIFSVLPVFWALLDQMGSRWTLQATKMDGRFGFLTVKPDQMQVLSPIFILILIPLFQKYIYPFFEKRNMLKNPLHRLTIGGVLAGVAFIASATVEIYLKTTYPHLPQLGFSQLRIFNGNPCSVSIESDVHNITYNIPPHSYYINRDIRVKGMYTLPLNLAGDCIHPREELFLLEEMRAISFFLNGNTLERFVDNVDKSKSGLPFVRFLVTNAVNTTDITLYNDLKDNIEAYVEAGVARQIEVFSSTYSLRVNNSVIRGDLKLESGAVYTIVVDHYGSGYETNLIVMTAPNSITMALLLPQFFIMSVAEVLFAVTGNEFAFKESPESMKAVMTSVWLLTEAIGNIIIIIITRLFSEFYQETQFFIYTGLMFVAIAVFHYLSRGYQFGHGPDEDGIPKKECRSNSEILYLQIKQTEDCLDH